MWTCTSQSISEFQCIVQCLSPILKSLWPFLLLLLFFPGISNRELLNVLTFNAIYWCSVFLTLVYQSHQFSSQSCCFFEWAHQYHFSLCYSFYFQHFIWILLINSIYCFILPTYYCRILLFPCGHLKHSWRVFLLSCVITQASGSDVYFASVCFPFLFHAS